MLNIPQHLNIACLQFSPDLKNFKQNYDQIDWLLQQLEGKNIDIILLPELFATGFVYDHLDRIDDINLEISVFLQKKCFQMKSVIAGSLMEKQGNHLFNSLYIWQPGCPPRVVYRKIHLFFQMQEKEYFEPGERLAIIELYGIKIGLAICFDLRFPELFAAYRRQGVDGFLIPAQWPQKRIGHWFTLLQARAIEHQAFVVGCNASAPVLGGLSAIIDCHGSIQAQAGEDKQIILAHIDLMAQKQWRSQFPVELSLRSKSFYFDSQLQISVDTGGC